MPKVETLLESPSKFAEFEMAQTSYGAITPIRQTDENIPEEFSWTLS